MVKIFFQKPELKMLVCVRPSARNISRKTLKWKNTLLSNSYQNNAVGIKARQLREKLFSLSVGVRKTRQNNFN